MRPLPSQLLDGCRMSFDKIYEMIKNRKLTYQDIQQMDAKNQSWERYIKRTQIFRTEQASRDAPDNVASNASELEPPRKRICKEDEEQVVQSVFKKICAKGTLKRSVSTKEQQLQPKGGDEGQPPAGPQLEELLE